MSQHEGRPGAGHSWRDAFHQRAELCEAANAEPSRRASARAASVSTDWPADLMVQSRYWASEANMLLINLLRIAGVSLLGLFVLNFFVPRQFHWREEMARLSLINRRIFQVHAIFIAMILLMMGLLLVLIPGALLQPQALARSVLAGLTVF